MLLAVWVSFRIRFDPVGLELKSRESFEHPHLLLLSVLVAYLAVSLSGLYQPLAFSTRTGSALRSASAAGCVLLGLTLLQALSPNWKPGRGILLLSLILWAHLLYLFRRAAIRWSPRLRLIGAALIVAPQREAARLEQRLRGDSSCPWPLLRVAAADDELSQEDLRAAGLVVRGSGVPTSDRLARAQLSAISTDELLARLEERLPREAVAGRPGDSADLTSFENRLLRLVDVLLTTPFALFGASVIFLSHQHRRRNWLKLWHVVRGRLSLVGPDPDRLPTDSATTPDSVRELLLSVPPGLIPWVSADGDYSGSLEEDLYYARYRSFGLYLLALVRRVGRLIGKAWSAGAVRTDADTDGPDLRSPAPRSLRLVDGATAVFALWTVTCHAVVFAGGVFQNLVTAWVLVLLAAAWSWRAARKLDGATATATKPSPPAGSAATAFEPRLVVARRLGLFFAVVALAVVATTDDWVLRWAAVLAVLVFGLVVQLLLEDRTVGFAPEPPRQDKAAERWLWCLVLLSVILSLLVHRPDLDDALYINFAVSALDLPQWRLLRTDVLLGIPELPLHLSLYQLHSIELWNALLAWLTGLSPIQTFHWLSTAMGAALVPLAGARLFRCLVPRLWPWAVSFYVLILFTIGDSHRWYGNFAFVRIWQGKGIFLFVFLPLVWVYGMALARRPNLRNWLWLAAAMVASVGSSSTALWVAPTTALMAIATARRPSLRTAGLLLAGISSSIYMIATALLMKDEVAQLLANRRPRLVGEEFSEAVTTILGDSRLFLAAMAVLLVAWALAPNRLARRFALVSCVAVWGILLNPFLSSWMVAHVTGAAYWRGFWALPLPVLMSLVLAAPLGWRQPALVWARVGLALAAAAALTLWIPKVQLLSSSNRVALRFPPELKVAKAYDQAARLNQLAPPRSFVVAPQNVSAWVTTFRHHVYPLAVRRYLRLRPSGPLNQREILDREAMVAYAGGGFEFRGPKDHPVDVNEQAEIFSQGLERYGVSAVCLHSGVHHQPARAGDPERERFLAPGDQRPL